jgi:choloylglycine hydrolase
MSVMRNISPTWWRTLIDHKNGLYYFDSALSPQMVWVNLNQIDLKSGAVACAPSRL